MVTVKAEIEKQEQNLAKINIEIPSEQASQEYNKACRRISQRINVPGFRKGKAPRGVVEKQVGVDRIKQEALDRLLPPAFADVISEHQLDIVAPPQIEEFNFDLKEGISVKAQVELRPECKLPDLTGLKVEVPSYKVPEDAEQKELDALVERMTSLETVIDRETNGTDIVNIDFEGTVAGEAIKGGSAKNYRLDLGSNTFIEGFSEQLVGKKISDDFEIKVTFPAEYHDKDLAGKEAEFKVTINEIKEKVVPELTDELAKKMGDYEDIAQLKEDIKKRLEEGVERENTFRKQKHLIEEVVKQAEVEVPDSMVNREAKLLMDEVKGRLQGQGHSWEQFVELQGQENVWNNLLEEGRQRIKTSLVFGSIAKQEGVSVTEDEFSAQVSELAMMSNVDEKTVMRQLANNTGAAQSMNDQILSQKIVDLLSEKTEFTFVEEKVEEEKTEDKQAETKAGEAKTGNVTAPTLEGEEFEVLEES